MEYLYLINAGFAFFSWVWAMEAFEKGNNVGGYANLFASALNAAAVAYHIF